MQTSIHLQCNGILLQTTVCRQYAKSSSCVAALYFHFALATLLKPTLVLTQVKLQRLQQEYANAQLEVKKTRQSAAVDIQDLHQLASTKISQLQVQHQPSSAAGGHHAEACHAELTTAALFLIRPVLFNLKQQCCRAVRNPGGIKPCHAQHRYSGPYAMASLRQCLRSSTLRCHKPTGSRRVDGRAGLWNGMTLIRLCKKNARRA